MPSRSLLTFLWTLIPLFFFDIPFLFFAPYLIISIYRSSQYSALWQGVLCGGIIDLLSASSPFGLYAINYTLTTWMLYSRRQTFFEDKLSTLPLMTTFFSFLSTFILMILHFLFGHKIAYSWKWVGSDLITMSLADGFYALLWYSLPLYLVQNIRRVKFKEGYA